DQSDLFIPGVFAARLQAGDSLTLVLSAEPEHDLDAQRALETEHARAHALLTQAHAENSAPVVQQLVLAADQFLVQRGESGRSVIACYHWFNDWGRDTMIAWPGLTLATGRPEEAANILRTFS